MSILLIKAVKVGGVELAAGTSQTLEASLEADLVTRKFATYTTDPRTNAGVPVMATTDLTGGSSFSDGNSTLKLPAGETDLSGGVSAGSSGGGVLISASITINASNESSYAGKLLIASAALTITIDGSVGPSFWVNVTQSAVVQPIIVGSGMTLRNAYGHVKTNGAPWDIATVWRASNDLVLFGATGI